MGVVIAILADAGFTEAADRLRVSDLELMAAYRARIASSRADMALFGANGVPALVVGKGDSRRLLPSGALFGGPDMLIAQLEAA
jgi:putative protein-disulfide isomerase